MNKDFNNNSIKFPQEMTQETRWGSWYHGQEDGLLTKKPWDPVHNNNGKVNDPRTWTTYQQAFSYYNPQDDRNMAFYCGNSWCLLDLDHIRQEISDYQQGFENIITDVFRIIGPTYAEISTSGEGLHFIFQVDQSVKNFGSKKRASELGHELYHDKRFIALTGNCFNGCYHIVVVNQDQWARLYRLVFNDPLDKPSVNQRPNITGKINHRSDKQLSTNAMATIKRILASSDGANFDRWLNGSFWESTQDAKDHGVQNFDHSEVDLKCCNVLAYHTACNPQLMDEIFRHTGLYRSKWDEWHGSQTYGDMTIAKAVEDKQKYFAAV